MLSTNQAALSARELLRRCDAVVALPSFQEFAEWMGRLVAADLVSWLGGSFFVTTAGRAVSPLGQGHYFKDLFAETLTALNDRVPRPEPIDLGMTNREYDEALAYVAEVKERNRTRRDRSGYEKWAEWDDAPPLDFGDCIEFLTFSEGRGIVVKTENAPSIEFSATGEDSEIDVNIENAVGDARFEGTLAIPLPRSADPDNPRSVIFPVLDAGNPANGHLVPLRGDHFAAASYSSYDGVDYFSLRMEFDDGGAVTIVDDNAPPF